MKIKYLKHTIKSTANGYRIPRLGGGTTYRTLREAKNAVAAAVFPYPYVGGPPIKDGS